MSWLERVRRALDEALVPDALADELDRTDAAHAADPAQAVARLEEIVRERPTWTRARVMLARAHASLGDLGRATELIRSARAEDPTYALAAFVDGEVSLSAGDVAHAADAARDAAHSLNGIDAEAYAEACALRARVERARNRPDRAVRELHKALDANPSSLATRVALCEALAAAGRVPELRLEARQVRDGATPDLLSRVGVALARAGEPYESIRFLGDEHAPVGAEGWFWRARAEHDVGAFVAAEHSVRRAIALSGGADALALLADVLEAQQRGNEALAAREAVARVRGDLDSVVRVARAVPLDDMGACTRAADALAHVSRDHPLALALRAHALLSLGAPDAALALLPAGPRASLEPRFVLVLARAQLAAGLGADAAGTLDAHAHIRDSLSPADRDAWDDVRRRAEAHACRGAGGEVDLRVVLERLAGSASRAECDSLVHLARSLVVELDQPLRVAVTGEFNAGKSTFVNAFLGADVAPTGILPTTAVLHVLRGGAERFVRLVRRDGTIREGDFGSLKRLLAESDAASLSHVEVLVPNETLDRVWLLDSPGTNALDEAHDARARDATEQADAVVWLLSATQAAKASELAHLTRLHARGTPLVLVVNKRDRLAPGELERVLGTLAPVAAQLDASLVVSSAREALAARLAGDDAAVATSGFADVTATLERVLFSRSRILKAQSCARRLLAALDDEARSLAARAVEERAELMALEAEEAALPALSDRLQGIGRARNQAFDVDLRLALASLAEEVVAVVQPRRGLQRPQASLRDREDLIDILEDAFRDVADHHLTASVEEIGRALSAAAPELAWDALALRRALAPCFEAARGRATGALSPRIDEFFDQSLPRLSLTVDALREQLPVVLGRDLDRALGELEDAHRVVLDDLAARLRARRDALRKHLQMLENQGLAYAATRAVAAELDAGARPVHAIPVPTMDGRAYTHSTS